MEISEGGMFIDVDSDTHGVVSLNGTTSSEKTFMQQSGIVGSYMEHSIFEQMFKVPSVSTIKILQEANSSGIPIYTVNKDNISTVLPKLQIDESVKTDVSNAVNSGKVVTIPQRNIQYFNWNGTGYIVMDSATGAAGYMISGGLAGGSFSVERFLGKLCQAIVTMAIIAGALMLCSFLVGFIVTPMLYFAVDLLIDAVIEFLTLMFYISFIDTVVEFASDPSGEKFEDVLIDALFVGFGLYLNGFGDETSGEKGYIDVLKETFPDFFEKTSDMGIEDEVAAKLIEKSPSESAALEEIETFKDQGLSNERISEICENLNTEEIDIFKDILNDNPGKYTDTDYAKIQDLLEQCGTKAEMDGLRNDISKLDEYGIKPSDYESMGINTPERINGVAEALSKLRFKEGYAEHLRNVISFNRDATKGIVGGHNMDEFMNYFRNVEGLTDADFIVSKTPHPTINGIYEITYKVPLKDSAGNILEGQYKVFKNPKTVYDPSVISDAEMLKWGEEAMKNGIINNTINGREITGTASNGLRFKGFIDDSVTDATEITNFFPILQ